MGQSLGKEEVEQTKEKFFKQYQLVEEKEDQHYGQIKVFEKNYDAEENQPQSQNEDGNKKGKTTRLYQKARTLAIKESVYQDSDTIEKDLLNMKQLIQITEENHNQKRTQNLIDVFEYFIQSEEKFCSSVQRIQLVMEYLQRDIQIEVKTKKLQNQRFTPQEIFTIAFSCINSLYNLQQINLAHGDLKTSNILVSEYFEIKLIHPAINRIIPSFATIIAQKTCGETVDTQGIYLSPILTKAVAQKNYQPQHNPFKSDVFTLGTVDNLYNYETGDFNENQLKIHLTIIKNQYGIDVHDLIVRMIKIQEQDRPDFIELAAQLNIINQMNEVYNQQQQMIEQQSSLKICPGQDKYGVSLFKALNTEAEEYNYNQKQNSVSNSFIQNNNYSMTAASSIHNNNPNNISNTNNISSSQHPSFGVNQSLISQQNPPQSQALAPIGQSLYGNAQNQDIPPANPKPNAFFPQQSQIPLGNSNVQQPLAQSQAQSQQPSIPLANPKHQSLSRQQSHEALQQQGISQPHNFTNINQTPISGVTLIKSNSQYNPANSTYNPTQVQYNLIPPSIPNNQPPSYSNVTAIGQNNLPNQQQPSSATATNLAQSNINIPTTIQSSYLGPTQIQNPTNVPTYQPTSNYPSSNQFNQQSYKLQTPVTQPQTQYSYTGHLNINQPSYDPTRSGISLVSNNNPISQTPANSSTTPQNYQIPEDVQKIINEFKEKQKQNDQIYSEKERLNQSNVKYQIVSKDSPAKLEGNSSRSMLNISPQNNISGQGNLYVEQKQQLDLLLSQNQQQPNTFYQSNQQPLQQNQIIQQLTGQYSQPNQVQQSLYQQNPMANSQIQAQQLIGVIPAQNQYLQRSSSQQQQLPLQGVQNTTQITGSQYNPMIQQSYNFSAPPGQPQQGIMTSNVFTSTDSQRNKYEHIHETYDDQSHYIGEKLGGLRHGTGKFFYADGGYYEGEWCEGRMEGLGTLYYPSGSLAYLGQWRNDQFNGKGTVYNESPSQIIGDFDYTNFDNLGEYWVKYEGDFKDDNKEGIGTIYLSNGDRFTGNFNNDFVHGQGTYFRENQNPVQGIWDCNHLIQYL